jgi:hypothetical protein
MPTKIDGRESEWLIEKGREREREYLMEKGR